MSLRHRLAAALRADPTTSGIGIVLVSSLDSPADLARGRQAGADAYLPKPCDLVTLEATVRDLAARSDHSHRPGRTG